MSTATLPYRVTGFDRLGIRSEQNWHQWRAGGIGASEAGAVLGASPWSTPLEVYYRKIGEAPPVVETLPMRIGRELEPLIASEYTQATGRKIIGTQACLESLPHPFLRATLDGMTGDDRPVEFKYVGPNSAAAWGEPGTDQIPEHYAAQVHHQLIVTGAPSADVAALIAGHDALRIYTIHADPGLHAEMVDRLAAFWGRVERRDPPPVTERDWGMIARLRPTVAATIDLDDEAARLASEYLDLSHRIGADTKRKGTLKGMLCDLMRGHTRASLPDGKTIDRAIIDRKGFTVEAKSYSDFRIRTPKGDI